MRQTGSRIKGIITALGCFSASMGFSQISHAATPSKQRHVAPRHIVALKKTAYHGHVATKRTIVHHPVLRHVTTHHAIIRRTFVHHPEAHAAIERHPVYRRVASHRPDYRHGYTQHRIVHQYIRHASYLWCVPYAREVSHIDLSGDAFLWWAEAAGRYARGARPAEGAVLNFRSSGRIPLGHVAVVEQVVNSREILVNQANWIPDRVSHDVPVMDVSPNNNWSEVQVGIGGGKFGATYPTYGFIYGQRPGFDPANTTEVAEAPPVHKIRLTAPNRTLR